MDDFSGRSGDQYRNRRIPEASGSTSVISLRLPMPCSMIWMPENLVIEGPDSTDECIFFLKADETLRKVAAECCKKANGYSGV